MHILRSALDIRPQKRRFLTMCGREGQQGEGWGGTVLGDCRIEKR
jgi:hypothetical protein